MPALFGWTVMDTAPDRSRTAQGLVAKDLAALLKTQPSLWRGRDQPSQHDAIKTGFADLDAALPGGGWGPGTLTELLVEHEGSGELSLLLPAIKNITQQRQWAAMVKPPHIPYAPALANAGIQLDRMLIVDTANDKDALWASEQILRAGIFTLVICWLHKTSISTQRRIQLAAETGRALAVAYRPASATKEPSAAALRIALSTQHAAPAGVTLDILKSRGGKNQSVFIQAHDFDACQGVEWPGSI